MTIENNDNKTIGLKPRTLITPYTENFIEENWITVSPSEVSLKPGEKEDFEVKVRYPKMQKLGAMLYS